MREQKKAPYRFASALGACTHCGQDWRDRFGLCVPCARQAKVNRELRGRLVPSGEGACTGKGKACRICGGVERYLSNKACVACCRRRGRERSRLKRAS